MIRYSETPEFTTERSLLKVENSLKHLRIADLEIFITAAHMKSLGKSAAFHSLSQSAASVAIQRVEAAFGIHLCTHERRQFTLTQEGQILLPRVEKWVHELRELIVSKEELPIRVVTTHAIGQIAVPGLLQVDHIQFSHMRPDLAYGQILHGEADIALVLDNAPWKGVISAEISRGSFGLYGRKRDLAKKPVLLPEDQMEVLSLQQTWKEVYNYPLPIKTRVPSWSLIASICAESDEVGYLPDFLAKKYGLYSVLWQPEMPKYRILALYKEAGALYKERVELLLKKMASIF